MRRVLCAAGTLLILATGPALSTAPAAPTIADATARAQKPAHGPATARSLLAAIRPSPDLQAFLERTIADIGRSDPKLLASSLRVCVIDLRRPAAPVIAQIRGNEKVYPASVVKFVYLMAAYAWQEQGRLRIDPTLDAQLDEMIRESSNQATRKVFSRLTATEPGPELPATEYARFREQRHAVKRWLQSLGIDDLHAVHPTYDGNGDLFGRDQQFLRDRTVGGGLADGDGAYPNRQAMTASGTARLLALLATDRALSPADSAAVRKRMQRDVREQPHLVHRIAGGVSGLAGAEVYAKSGTWGPIYADAGIVRDAGGAQFAIAVFTDAHPPYRGDAIAHLTRHVAAHLFSSNSKGEHP